MDMVDLNISIIGYSSNIRDMYWDRSVANFSTIPSSIVHLIIAANVNLNLQVS